MGCNARSRAFTIMLKERLDSNCAPSDFLLFISRTVCYNKAKPGSHRMSKEVVRHARRAESQSRWLHMTQQTWEETSSCHGDQARQQDRTQRTQQCHFSQGQPSGMTMRTLKAV